MELVEFPTSIEQAIISVSEYGLAYAIECSPKCGGIKETWVFENGTIMGPSSCTPPELSNEQWINKCMAELYAKLDLSPIEPNTFYRFVATNEEFGDAELGKFRISQNHRNCEFTVHENCVVEKGKSVAIGPFLTYFKDHPLSFLLAGDLLPENCSDGAPLLAVNENLKLASKLMPVSELLTKFYEQNKAVLARASDAANISDVDLFNLSLGIWDNYWPANRD